MPSETKKPGDATTEEEEDAPAKPAAGWAGPPPARPPTVPSGTPVPQPAGATARAQPETKEAASRPVGLRHLGATEPEPGKDEA